MKKQKVCIIGGGLSGLITAIMLSKYNLSIDLVVKKFDESTKDFRSTAFSKSNYDFFNKLGLTNNLKKEIWPVKEIKIYNINQKLQLEEILKFKEESEEDKILYMIHNKIFIEKMKKIINKKKIIKLKLYHSIKKNLNLNNYNLIINCTGPSSLFTTKISNNRNINLDYDEISATMIVNHYPIENCVAKQIFLNEGPLALLPISNTKTSIVWSIKKKYLSNELNKRNIFIKNNLKNLLKNFFKIKNISSIQYNELSFHLAKSYFKNRILNFGDVLHKIHPFVGQGFNMIIRDLIILEKIIKYKLKLGLDIGDLSSMMEFSENSKSQNFVFASSINILNKLFSLKKGALQQVRDFSLKKVNQNVAVKKIFLKFADKGLNF